MPSPEKPTIEKRFDVIEYNLHEIEMEARNAHTRIERLSNKIAFDLYDERRERKEAHRKLEMTIKDAAAGNFGQRLRAECWGNDVTLKQQ